MNPNPTRALSVRFARILFSSSLLALSPLLAQAPAQPAGGEEVVKLDAFKVTTSIDTYHQTQSSMASKLPMDLKEIASSLSVINSAAITDRNAVILTDVVPYVVGATSSQNAVNGFSFRGFPNTGSYTQNIQYDGLMGATLKKGGSSASNVDSLEFLKGPNGVLYGQMNPGGLLNIVTKNPKETRETNLRATVGTFAGKLSSFGDAHTETFSIDTTGPAGFIKGLYYRLVADVGRQPSSRPGNWDNAFSVYPALTYKWSRETQLTFKFEVSEDFRRQDDGMMPIFTNNTAYGPAATWYLAPLNTVYNDTKDKATDRGSAAAMKFQTKLPGEWYFRLQSRSVWHLDIVRELTVNNQNIFNPASTFARPTSTLRRQYNYVKNGHRYNFVDLNAFHTFTTGAVKQTVLVGVGGGGEFFGNARVAFGPNQTVAQAISLTNPVINQVDYPANGTGATNNVVWQGAFGQYLSDQIKIGEKLNISLGIRRDHQRVHGTNTLAPVLTTFATELKANTKQAGVVYAFTPAISAYASYSQSIKPQTSIAFDSSGNNRFPPESGEQYEGGVKFSTANRNVNLTLATYQIERSNVIVASGTTFTVPTGAGQVGQAISRLDGGQKSKGIEAEFQWQPIPNWQLSTGYAHSVATITASLRNPTTVGMDLSNAPRDSGNFWTRYNFASGALKGLGVGLGAVYVGRSWVGDPTTTLYYRLPGWTRLDGSAYYAWKNYRFSLNIQNLLDRQYAASAQSANNLNIGEQRKLTLSVSTKL